MNYFGIDCQTKPARSAMPFIILLFIHLNSFSQYPKTGFFADKGTLQRHPFADNQDSLSSGEIFELRSENGLPIWFAQDINKIVCLSKACRKVHLWLFWDGTGNFHGFQINENEPLTKTDHNEFQPIDYQKLNQILSDSISILKKLNQDDLIVKQINTESKVDAISGATQPFLKESLVRNAAYTCYTLWHIVYGNTRLEILKLLEQRTDSNYLQRLFNQDDPVYKRWAIQFIRDHQEYHTLFYRQIVNQIKSKDANLSNSAMDYFNKELIEEPEIQKVLSTIFDKIPYQCKFELAWKLSEVKHIDDEAALTLLQLFEDHTINATLLKFIYKSIHAENLKNTLITEKLKKFSNNKNLFVRNITNNLLSE